MKKIEEMKKSMLEAGVMSPADIEEICELEKAYLEECETISEMCVEEDHPSHGSIYDLRCAEMRKLYDERIAEIEEKYEETL